MRRLFHKEKIRVSIGVTLFLSLVFGLVCILLLCGEGYMDSFLGASADEKGHAIEMKEIMTMEWDDGFVVPLPDVTSQVAVLADFDGSQVAIHENMQKAYEVVTANEDILLKQDLQLGKKTVTVSFKVEETGYDVYLYGGFDGAISNIEVIQPDMLSWGKFPYLMTSEPKIIENALVGEWQVVICPYDTLNLDRTLMGVIYGVRKPHPVGLKLPRNTNQKKLIIDEQLQGKWFYDIRVKSVESGVTETFTTQKMEIPLFEGDNEVIINLTDGVFHSLDTVYYVKLDTVLPELRIVFPPDYIEGMPILVTDDQFGIGVTCDDLKLAYIDGQISRSEQWEDGQYFGKNLKLKRGTHRILIEVIDDAGNYVSKIVEVIRK